MTEEFSVKKRVMLAIGFALVLIALPFSLLGWISAITGDYLHIGEVLGWGLAGVIAAFFCGSLVVTLWFMRKWRGLVILLTTIALVDLVWIPVIWAENYRRRPYERTEIVFSSTEEPTVDFSGIWKGEWKDEQKSYSDPIVLKLEQNGSSVSGSISTESGRVFTILEGVVSGDRLNIYYDSVYPGRSQKGGGGSLVGRVDDRGLAGKWYAHERPKRGWSRDGPWKAVRISSDQSN